MIIWKLTNLYDLKNSNGFNQFRGLFVLSGFTLTTDS